GWHNNYNRPPESLAKLKLYHFASSNANIHRIGLMEGQEKLLTFNNHNGHPYPNVAEVALPRLRLCFPH
ncbi:MAG: hypothetical protein MJY96_08645, partial [Bacteroidaceae bacterium]|nr:hypothetical protein [Bacteroidaceae bacterium]